MATAGCVPLATSDRAGRPVPNRNRMTAEIHLDYPRPVRLVAVLTLLLAVALGASACGPVGPTDPGGAPVDPVTVADALPSPEPLRPVGGAREVDAEGLVDATIENADPATAERLTGRGFRTAAIREWTAPGGGMTAAVSVWSSGVVATNVAGATAERLLEEPGAEAWTPRGLPGSRGVRAPNGRRALGKAAGPNSLLVIADGDVPEDVVVRSLRRLIAVAEGQGA